MAGITFFTHFCDCSVNTELIHRNNCAKNSFNRFRVGAIVYWQYSTAFALEHSLSLDNGLVDRNTGCPLSLNLIIISSGNSVTFSLWIVFVIRIPLLVWSRSEEWPLSWWESLRIERTLVFFGLLTGSPDLLSRRTPGRTPFHPCAHCWPRDCALHGPIRFPQHLFSVHDHGRQRSDRGPQHPFLPLRWPDSTSSRLRTEEHDEPVTQSIATPEPGCPGPHPRSSRSSLRPWMCHHTRELTISPEFWPG